MRPEPAFEAPWHAQIFALTVHLNETGHFEWGQWAERFGMTLKKHGLIRELNGGEDYFAAWLETLESYLADTGMADGAEITALRDAWQTAYLSTEHGEAVRLESGEG